MPSATFAGTFTAYVNAEKSPGATVVLVCLAYAVADSQDPGFHADSSGATPQVVLSSRQAARFTWVEVPETHAVVPVFAKKTENDPVSPGCRLPRNADSN